MDLSKQFDSPWLKAKLNVREGDNIKFLDEGIINEDKVDLKVSVMRNGEEISQKKFTINATNFRTVAQLYGTDTKQWIGKEMEVSIYKARNPRTNSLVDAIMLTTPSIHQDEEETNPEDLPF
jgi:hypothetical protein